MAVTITTDLVTLYDGNSAFGGGTTYSGFQRFGTAANGVQVSNTTSHFTGTVTSFSLVGRSIYSWMVGPGSIALLAQGGYRIVIGDGTNTRAYYTGGRDYKSFTSQGWLCLNLNGDNLPTLFDQLAGAAAPNLSALTLVGVGFNVTSKAVGSSPNCFFDIARVGTGLNIAGGTTGDPGTFLNIVTAEDSAANAWGIVEDLGGGTFGVQGKLTFGSLTANTVFRDENKTVVYETRLVPNNFYSLTVIGGVSFTNEFRLGVKLGTGESAVGINGCTISSGAIGVTINFNNANINTLGIYGCSFTNLGNQNITFSNNVGHELLNSSIGSCGQVLLNSVFSRNNNFINTTSTVGSILWNSNINIKKSSFIGNTNGVQYLSATGTPFTFDGLTFNGNTVDINNDSTAIVINATNGSNPTTFTGTVTINNPVTLTLTGLVTDSEVRIYRTSDNVELGGVESSGVSFAYPYNYGGDVSSVIVVHKETYEYLRINDFILTNQNSTIPIQQRFDRNYSNPI
jgi:hypothetical protein